MNERIQELYMQAIQYADSVVPAERRYNDIYYAIVSGKHAELIVRECARLAIEKQTENDVSGIVSKNPAKDFAYALVEHFGVEE
jgi:hypothetical protein